MLYSSHVFESKPTSFKIKFDDPISTSYTLEVRYYDKLEIISFYYASDYIKTYLNNADPSEKKRLFFQGNANFSPNSKGDNPIVLV